MTESGLVAFRSGGGLRQQLKLIEEFSVRENLVVQVRAGRAARGPDVADDIAALNRLARLDFEPAQVRVASGEPEVVAQHDQVAVVAGETSRIDVPGGRRKHRAAFFR